MPAGAPPPQPASRQVHVEDNKTLPDRVQAQPPSRQAHAEDNKTLPERVKAPALLKGSRLSLQKIFQKKRDKRVFLWYNYIKSE